jgi:hypothetical protein
MLPSDGSMLVEADGVTCENYCLPFEPGIRSAVGFELLEKFICPAALSPTKRLPAVAFGEIPLVLLTKLRDDLLVGIEIGLLKELSVMLRPPPIARGFCSCSCGCMFCVVANWCS